MVHGLSLFLLRDSRFYVVLLDERSCNLTGLVGTGVNFTCLSSKPEWSEFIYHTIFFFPKTDQQPRMWAESKEWKTKPNLLNLLCGLFLPSVPWEHILPAPVWEAALLLSFPVRKAVYGCRYSSLWMLDQELFLIMQISCFRLICDLKKKSHILIKILEPKLWAIQFMSWIKEEWY